MNISINDSEHTRLLKDIEGFLYSRGYLLPPPLTYHDCFPLPIKEVLSLRDTPTALYLRGRADRLAIHPEHPIEIEYDAKTHKSTQYHDITLELVPLIHKMERAQLGVNSLIALRNPVNGTDEDLGFWASDIPPVRAVIIPGRWNGNPIREYFKALAMSFFPDADLVKGVYVRGTGDPFVIIDEIEKNGLQNWRELIINLEKAIGVDSFF